MAPKRVTSEARQRLLETADRLFYQDGVRAVGIDRIIAEAGVAKMSLYKYFPSKDDLILAVLEHREENVLAFFRAAMERHLPSGCRWNVPAGGMFFWVELPEGVDALELLPRAVERGVAFVPGSAFYAGAARANTLCEVSVDSVPLW